MKILKLTLVLVALSVLSPTWDWGTELERSSGQHKRQGYGRGIGCQECQGCNKDQHFDRSQRHGQRLGRGQRRGQGRSQGLRGHREGSCQRQELEGVCPELANWKRFGWRVQKSICQADMIKFRLALKNIKQQWSNL